MQAGRDGMDARVLYKKSGSTLVSKLYVPNETRGDDKFELRFSDSIFGASNGILGKTPIFYSSGDIEITSNFYNDIDYEANRVRQVIIIADGNINIDQYVTNIDAWIIAGGTLNTCSIDGVPQAVENLDYNTCNRQLTINGPVYAKNVVFSRTHGANANPESGDGDLTEPAERIDYTPVSLMWSYYMSALYDKPSTVHIKELAPRY